MRKLLFIAIVLQTIFAFGQKPSNNLKGSFRNKSFWSSYTSLEFNGKGKVLLNGKDQYEFFERNDSIFVMSEDGGLLLGKTGDNQLKGLNKKVAKYSFIGDDSKFTYDKKAEGADKRLQLIERYYTVNYTMAEKMFEKKKKGNYKASMEILRAENQKLCDANLDLSCMQLFVYSLTDRSLDLLSVLWDKNKKKVEDFKEDKELEKLGFKIINLGNPEGYGLLFSYYTTIGQDKKAQEINEKGKKEGCKLCLGNKYD